MKKIWTIILVIGVVCGMTACSDDDDKEVPKELVGEWELIKMEIGTLDASDADVKEIAEDMFTELSKEFYYGESLELNSDGTGVFKDGDIEYYTKKDVFTMIDEEGYSMSFTYKISGSKLIMTLNMRDMIINEMADELDKEELNYLKSTLKKFTVDFTFQK
ncbi:MAG: hypothetical protein LBV43_02695 [Prevotella sp.]|jgi:hypothetical protein|nr:hypothetical protein [Prevotella sp.]